MFVLGEQKNPVVFLLKLSSDQFAYILSFCCMLGKCIYNLFCCLATYFVFSNKCFVAFSLSVVIEYYLRTVKTTKYKLVRAQLKTGNLH